MDSVWTGLQLLMDLFIDNSELIAMSDQSIYEDTLPRCDSMQCIVSPAPDQDRLVQAHVISLLGDIHGRFDKYE